MGYDKHVAIIVTTHDKEKCIEAWDIAKSIFNENQVSNRQSAPINSWHTFFIGPDGSKEGWAESDVGDKQRSTFKDWLNDKAFDDGSNIYYWAEVLYEDDFDQERITDSSKKNMWNNLVKAENKKNNGGKNE